MTATVQSVTLCCLRPDELANVRAWFEVVRANDVPNAENELACDAAGQDELN